MMRRSIPRLLVVLTAISAGCRWQSGDDVPHHVAEIDASESPSSDDQVVNDAEPANTSSDEGPAPALSPTGMRNPQREIADPYYLIGRELGEWHLSEWAGSERLTMGSLRGNVLVVRFWTDEPDELEDSLRSLQALERLKAEFDGRPVTFVGVYHSKGSLVETEWDDVVGRATAAGLTLPLAYDRQWSTLNDWWRRRFDHLPTTPTFVIDPQGKITHLHPGPAYFPSDKPVDALCDADFRALREAIQQALPQRLADK